MTLEERFGLRDRRARVGLRERGDRIQFGLKGLSHKLH
jgi:hypothetical protein